MNQEALRKILGSNIKAERNRTNLKQNEVADILNINRKTYSKYENVGKFDSIILYHLSKIFDCSIDAFFVGIDASIWGNKKNRR